MHNEPLIGFHISIEKSLDLAFDRAKEIGCTTFQIFTRNPRAWKFKPLTAEQAAAFRDKRKRSGFRSVVAHMPYLPNLASSDRATMKASRDSLDSEVRRCDDLGIDFLVTHLGSHLGGGVMSGVRNVSEAVNEALAGSDGSTTLLLENMAGQKNSVGSRFEELMLILDLVKKGDRAAVCLDVCHGFAAGFDFGTPEAVERTMTIFDECVGYGRLKVVHLNDSKGKLGSNLDRHEYVGEGEIGRRGMKAFLHHNRVRERPLIMETPFADLKGMKRSISLVRALLR